VVLLEKVGAKSHFNQTKFKLSFLLGSETDTFTNLFGLPAVERYMEKEVMVVETQID